MKRKTETEKLKFGNGRQKLNSLYQDSVHTGVYIVVCVSRVILTYMPN